MSFHQVWAPLAAAPAATPGFSQEALFAGHRFRVCPEILSRNLACMNAHAQCTHAHIHMSTHMHTVNSTDGIMASAIHQNRGLLLPSQCALI